MTDHLFLIAFDGLEIVISGRGERRFGPFPDGLGRDAAMEGLFARWRAAARGRGGWAWKQTASRWVVTLPAGSVSDGLPLERRPVSRIG